MSSNNGILFNSVLRPKLLNNPFINLDFLLSHTAHFDNNFVLPFFGFITFEFTFYLFCTLNNFSTCFIMFTLREMC